MPRRRAHKSLVSCLLFLFGYQTASATAQPPAMSRELLLFMEVSTVITATGREQPITQAPSAITLITAEDIRQSGATSIPELLRSVPGLDFFRGSASNVSLAARGLNLASFARSRIQVFVDGLSVYEDVLGSISWHQIPIPLEEIDRIEIVRSPATALYGDKAFAGVVHILTKAPETLRGTQFSGTVGEASTGIANLIHAGASGNLSYKVSAGYDRTNQFPNPTIRRTSDELGRLDTRGHFQINYKLDEAAKVSLSGGIDEFDRREILVGDFPGQRGLLAGGLGFVKANYARGDFKIQLSYNRFDADLSAQLFLEDISLRADVYQAQLQHSMTLGDQNVLTGGVTNRFVAVDSPEGIGDSTNQLLLTFFLQDEWKVRENVALTAGVGVDIHPEAGVSASPRGSLVYSPWKDHTFRVSAAKAFRNPSVFENFLSLPLKILPPPPVAQPQTFILLGNTNLDPEGMLSYEMGYGTLLFERLRVRIDLFYSQLDRLIAARQLIFCQPSPFLPPALQAVRSINAGDGEVFGGEVAFDVFITPWLKGLLNYSYQERKGDVSLMGLASHHKGNTGLTLSFKNGFSATGIVHYVGEPEGPSNGVNPYTLVNLRLGYRFKMFSNEAELAIQAFNLFNDEHREFIGGDLIGRRVSGTIRYRF